MTGFTPTSRADGRRTIALLVPSLEIGGAERQVVELARHLDRSRWRVLVLTMHGGGALESELPPEVLTMDLRRRNPALFPFRLLSVLSSQNVEVIHAYLVTAQAWGILAGLVARPKIVLGVRDARASADGCGAVERIFNRALEVSPSLVDFVIFNSEAARRAKTFSVAWTNTCVISNGIDHERFKPREKARDVLRELVGVDSETLLVGTIANISVYKGHSTLMHAAARVLRSRRDVHFVCVGDDRSEVAAAVRTLAAQLGVTGNVHFLGQRADVAELMPGLDILCSSSNTESFSNAICEAMACALPCVVTDVGDSARIVGNAGLLVPPGDPSQLGDGIMELLTLTPNERGTLGAKARQRIVTEFSIERMVNETQRVYERLLGIEPTPSALAAPDTQQRNST